MLCVQVLSPQLDNRFLEGRDQAFPLARGRNSIHPRQTSLSPGNIPWLPPPPTSKGLRDSLGQPRTLQSLGGTVLCVYLFILLLPCEPQQGGTGTDWPGLALNCSCKAQTVVLKSQAIHFGQKIKKKKKKLVQEMSKDLCSREKYAIFFPQILNMAQDAHGNMLCRTCRFLAGETRRRA